MPEAQSCVGTNVSMVSRVVLSQHCCRRITVVRLIFLRGQSTVPTSQFSFPKVLHSPPIFRVDIAIRHIFSRPQLKVSTVALILQCCVRRRRRLYGM